jgi:hypothetical protein
MAGYPNYLIEAYEGYYEDEMAADLTAPMEEPSDVRAWVENKIKEHSTKERLAVYLEWNGILGYTGIIYDLVTNTDIE